MKGAVILAQGERTGEGQREGPTEGRAMPEGGRNRATPRISDVASAPAESNRMQRRAVGKGGKP